MQLLAKALFVFLNLWLLVAASQLGMAENGFVYYSALLALEFLAVFIHEAGHALVAKYFGCRIIAMAVMVTEYNFLHRKWSGMRPGADRDVGGYVLYDFDDRIMTRRKAAWIAAAGPLANIAAGALAAASVPLFAYQDPFIVSSKVETISPIDDAARQGMRAAPASLPRSGEVSKAMAKLDQSKRDEAFSVSMQGLMQIFALLSIGIALINLIPFKGSDGAKIRRELFAR